LPDKKNDFLKIIFSYRGIKNNPYIEELLSIAESSSDRSSIIEIIHEKRSELVAKYCFSIPFPFVLEEIKKYSPIVELGAGTGYYAWCLKKLGLKVEPFDLYSPDDEEAFDFMGGNLWFEETWTMVLSGDETVLPAYNDHALFLCWPPPESDMALNALEIFRNAGGRYLIYIGDPVSSAKENFFSELSKFQLVKELKIPSWKVINEKLMIIDLKVMN